MSNRKAIGILIALLSLSVIQIEAAWTGPFRITYNSGFSADPRIVVNGSFIYVVWGDNTKDNYEIYFKKSLDGGMIWQAVSRLTYNPGTTKYPELAVNGLNVYVVWENKTGDYPFYNPDIYFRKSTDGGTTWQSVIRLTYSEQAINPAIAVNGSNLYVILSGNTLNEIYLKISTDNGDTWQPLKRLTYNSGDSFHPAIAVNGSNIYVVWVDNTSGNSEIYLKKSSDGGGTWQPVKRLTYSPGESEFPDIAVDNTNIYVIWDEYKSGNNEIYFKTSSDGGKVWQTLKRLTYNSGFSVCPDINFIGSNIYVTWEDYTPGNAEIYIKKSFDNGANWQALQRLTFNSGRSMSPQIGLNTTKIYVFWFDDTPGNCEIFQKNSPIF